VLVQELSWVVVQVEQLSKVSRRIKDLCVDQALSQIGHISNWSDTHEPASCAIHAPYLIVNRIKIRTVRRPEVRRNELRSFTLKELDRSSVVRGMLVH